MGFFEFKAQKQSSSQAGLGNISIDLLHRKQCQVCPLNNQAGVKHPHMEAYGSEKPIVYMLGGAPGVEEDKHGYAFAGKSGKYLRRHIPQDWADHIRWNNCVRTRSLQNRAPSFIELEACRPSVEADIARTKPVAIFGFGAVPLRWALDQTRVSAWNGRRVPIDVAGHKCWFYPMLHPGDVLRSFEDSYTRKGAKYRTETEFVFTLDMQRAFAEIDDLPAPRVHTIEEAQKGVTCITGKRGWKDVDAIADFLDRVWDDDAVGYDYEATRLRPYRKDAKLLSVAIGTDKEALAFALDHRQAVWTREQREAVDKLLEDFIYNAPCAKVSHGLSYEHEWTGYFYGEDALRAQRWEDSMSQAFILDERQEKQRAGPLSLDFLCLQYFGIHLKGISNLDRKNMANEPLDKILQYNGMDAKYHLALFREQKKRLAQEGLQEVYEEHLRRIPAMVLTQLKGIPVDPKEVKKFYDDYTADIAEIEADIQALPLIKKYGKKTGKVFRPSANEDIKYVLKEMLGMEVESVDETVLKEVDHDIADLMLEWRGINKLLSTYVKPLCPDSPDLYPDGCLHQILHTTRTRTWRTSSDSPNIQNFPKRKNKEVRRQVRPGGDLRIVSFDYAGIQARNVAMESKDKALIKAFWERYDIHSDWCERILKAYPKWPKEGAKVLAQDKALFKKYRNVAKNGLVFPSFFGAQYKKIAAVVGIPEKIAIKLHEEFWDMFPDIKGWHEGLHKSYYKTGYVTGLSGFRRRAPITPNELINAPIQADEAIIVCNAMARLSEMEDDRFQPIMEIHDDLTFLWHKKEIEKNAEVVIKTMLDVPFEWAHVVPLGVEMEVGENWADQQGVGEFFSDQGSIVIDRSKII